MNYGHTRTQLYKPQQRAVKTTRQTRRGLRSELPSGLVNVRNSQQGVEGGKKRLFACAASAVVQMGRCVIGFQSCPLCSWQRDFEVNIHLLIFSFLYKNDS